MFGDEKDSIGFEEKIPLSRFEIEGANELSALNVKSAWNTAGLEDPTIGDEAHFPSFFFKMLFSGFERVKNLSFLIFPSDLHVFGVCAKNTKI